MPVALLAIVTLAAVFIGLYTATMDGERIRHLGHGDYEPTTRSLTLKDKNFQPYDNVYFGEEEKSAKKDLQIVENALLRACRTIHTLALENDCMNPYREGTVWQFIGAPGGNGELGAVWNNSTTSPVFSCGSIAEYGRNLVQKAIPKELIIANSFRYDFTDMGNEDSTDPCGYTQIVGR
ncbi:MAG: hypothetical protein JW771_08300 [Candidatus Thermoplasmatota archaeon]|nr:hypothetical protein [Candidatus Thermoplasmatota archaeon]